MAFYGTRPATTTAGVQQQPAAGATGAAGAQGISYYNKAHSTLLPDGPRDSISHLAWSNDGSLLSCTSWDNSVRIWQVCAGFGTQLQVFPKFCAETAAPLLCSSFGPASNHLFVGGCDKTAKLYDLLSGNNNPQVVAQAHRFLVPHMELNEMLRCVGDGRSVALFFHLASPRAAKLLPMSCREVALDACEARFRGKRCRCNIRKKCPLLHDQPVCSVAWNPLQNVLVTASWDGFVRMWDGKQQQPIWQQTVGGKIFRMGVHNPFLALCDNFRNVIVLNLSTLFHGSGQHQQPMLKMNPPLQKLQSRSMGFFPDKEQETPGLAVGGIEGRVGICHFKPEHRQMNFSFKCHRQETPQGIRIYAVNAVDFHTKHGTFATGGADGSITVWDKVNRQKLRSFDNMGSCIADVKFDPMGNNLLAYALSYDWHKGPDQQEMAKGHQVYVHVMKEEDVRPRPKTATRR